MTDNRINAELLSISAAAANIDTSASYEATLHTKERDIWLSTIEYVDIVRDYNGKISDVTRIAFLLPLGDFVNGVYKVMDNLEITLVNHKVGGITRIRYKLVLEDIDPKIKNGIYNKTSTYELNKQGMTKTVGQCVSKTIEKLRDATVFGAYKESSVEDVLNVALTESLSKIDIEDFNFKRNVNITPTNNARVYDHILIPDTVHALDLASYLHHGDYGVYNGGVGTYVQTVKNVETLFIYPLYRSDVVASTDIKLQITVAANQAMVGIDSTYGMQGDILKILVSMLNTTNDNGEADLKNKGVGVTLTDSESVMTRPVEVSKDKVVTKPDNIKRKMVHKETKDMSLKTEQYGVTNNTYDARSSVLKSDGKVLQVQWNHSNGNLIIPGTGLTFMIEEEETINIYPGVVQGVHIATDNNTKMEITVLSIFVGLNTISNFMTNTSETSKKALTMLDTTKKGKK